MAVDHYENFPVASLLLPAHLRAPVTAIYRFARHADDLADEGDLPQGQRLAGLQALDADLTRIERGDAPREAVCVPLAPVIRAHDLPLALFRDLLSAFRQDVVQTRYASFHELRDYCRRSANPVGRLMLRLYGADSEPNRIMSDDICTSLQLINHWQDVAVDWRKGRIYLPQDELARHGVTEDDIAAGRCGDEWQALMRFQVGRARALMLSGLPLVQRLSGRVAVELAMMAHGGLRILDRIDAVRYDVFRARPTLTTMDWPLLFWRAVTTR
jgi:phytoene synthase